MSKVLASAFIAMLALMFAGAAAHAGAFANPGDDPQQQFEAWEKRKLKTRRPAQLFRSAAEIRLFAWYDDFTTSNVTRVQLRPKGVILTASETQRLRGAVFFTEPPPAIAACCIPRHAFKFYDKQKNEIGALDVCFECSCARIEGEKSPNPNLMWIDWDNAVIAAIVEAHNLPIHPKAPDATPAAH